VPKLSAGVLVFRVRDGTPQVLLVHPGGPFWKARDDGAWSVPKGEYDAGEEPLDAAMREFREELGVEPPGDGEPVFLGELRQSSGKRVSAWAIEGDLDPATTQSNTFTMEWPPRSGRQAEFPEVDRAGWFGLDDARRKLVRGQAGFIDRLEELLAGGS
jgi:predicted NUDIX family NTP pyrophosphohydrolase